ncbi:MAG: hsp70 family protein, partial [Fibrobacterota bacterium]|nr:hsp70 family protein [Fibrobacterota bacterium]
ALYLEYLRAVWNLAMAGEDERCHFDRQHIVITVPASFDQGAQKLTLEASRLAGYPAGVRLLEEPQAAFYSWLERHPHPEALQSVLGAAAGAGVPNVLVCDIGGGTTDFSRFSVEFRGGSAAQITRLAVSDHILLGGDNMDLAIAHYLESQVVEDGAHLDPAAWQRLVAESRHVKETALAHLSGSDGAPGRPAEGETGKTYRVGIAGTGGNLFAQTRTATITEAQLTDLIDNGFFPECGIGDRPRAAGKGLREMGLPYASDSAVTRYLASFLSEGASVDAILFNGGALTPAYLQYRLRDLTGRWQGRDPVILENRELDLAVARGAAMYGRNLALGLKAHISAGSGHGYYLEAAAQEKQDARYLISILPLGTESERTQTIAKLDLRLALNRPIEFRLYDSTHRSEDRAGNILKHDADVFRELPPLRTVARLDAAQARALGSQDVAVGIQAVMNSLGLLQVHLVSTDKRIHPPARWELEFDMRALGGAEAPLQAVDADEDDPLAPEARAAAAVILSSPFTPGLLGQLEKAVGRHRGGWPRSWLRQFWEPLYVSIAKRGQGPEYEAAWLNAAGYFLRPGFAAVLDDFRIDQLWHIQAVGLAHPRNKAIRDQYWLMWRRVAGGLSAQRQGEIFTEARPLIESHHKLANEAVRMAGSFERLPLDAREWLLTAFLEGVELKRDQHLGHYLFALGRLLSRVPLYAGEESVLPAAAVEKCFGYFRDWNWADVRATFLPVLFAQACRITNHRSIDIPQTLRGAVLEKMSAAKANPGLIRQVREFVPMEREDLNQLFGDSLPLGLAIP